MCISASSLNFTNLAIITSLVIALVSIAVLEERLHELTLLCGAD